MIPTNPVKPTHTTSRATAFLLAFLSSVTIAPASVAAPELKTVSYRGVSIQVPADWPVIELASHPDRCVRFDENVVYVGSQRAQARCPAKLVGKTEAVHIEPLEAASEAATFARRRARVGGEDALTDPNGAVSGSLVTAFPRRRVAVTVTFGADRATAEEIASSIAVSGDTPPSEGTRSPSAGSASSTDAPLLTALAANDQPAPLRPAIFQGLGFDACTNPSTNAMQAWLSSPYRAIGIYIGGISRGCSQTLSASWVATVARMGWSFIPTYVGLQAPCTSYQNRVSTNLATAFEQGKQAGTDAMSRADLLGLPTGSPIYFDMEAFSYSNTGCRAAVQKFLDGWSRQLQHHGYLSGVYGSATSTMRSLVDVYNNPAFRRPSAIWNARWNGVATVWDEPEIPNTFWANHQRIHQYRGGHQERWGGVTINIDNNALDGPVVRWASVPKWVAGDVSGDGTTDLVHLCCNDYLNTWFSNGDGTYSVKSFRPWPRYALQAGRWLVADVSGDGKADLVHLCCGDYANLLVSNGDGTYTVTAFRPWAGYGLALGSWRAADLNNDGTTDLVHLCCGDYLNAWLSNGDGTFVMRAFRPWQGYALQSGSWQTGDVTGDGRADLVHLCCSDWANVLISNGDGTFTVKAFRPRSGYAIQHGSWQTGDVSGDGKADLVHLCCKDYANTWTSNGDGTFAVASYRPRAGYALQKGSWLTADISGDGKDDLVHVCCSDYVNVWTARDGGYDVRLYRPWAGYAVQSGSWLAADLDPGLMQDLVHLCCPTTLNSWRTQLDGSFLISGSPI